MTANAINPSSAAQSANSLKALNKAVDTTLVSKVDIFAVDPHLLQVEPDFNARGALDPDYWERQEVVDYIEGLADAYAKGRFVPAMVVVVRSGVIFVRDGHCRLRGLMLAISRGAPIKKIRVEQFSGKVEDEFALITQSDTKLPLSSMERAWDYQRRIDRFGWSIADIAVSVSKTQEHVRMQLRLLELPQALAIMIDRKQVAPVTALKAFDEFGAAAEELLQQSLEEANKIGKDKVTPKQVKAAIGGTVLRKPKLAVKTISSMRNSIDELAAKVSAAKVDDGEYLVKLSREDVEKLLELKASLDETAKAEKEFKDAKAAASAKQSAAQEEELGDGKSEEQLQLEMR